MIVRYTQRVEDDLAAILNYLLLYRPKARAGLPQVSKKQFA